MATQLSQLTALVGGQLSGDGSLEIEGATILAMAGPQDISLLDNSDKQHLLDETSACAIIVPSGLQLDRFATIGVDNVHAAFTAVVEHFRPPRVLCRIGVSANASISPSAKIAEDVDVYPGVHIGDDVVIGRGSTIHSGVAIMSGCRIEEDVTIFPNAVLYEDTVVGRCSTIHAGAVLGAYGFGYESGSGRHIRSAQLGNVEIGPDVEVGAGSTIDRGTYGPTSIGEGTKIDNMVQIAHNCRIGRHNILCAQVGIAGSSTTGDYVVMAGQVGVRDHVHVGTGAVLGAMAGVMNDIPDGETHVGVPATRIREQILMQAAFGRLPEMRKQLHRLQRKVDKLVDDDEPDKSAAA